jgi:hypothetical protein
MSHRTRRVAAALAWALFASLAWTASFNPPGVIEARQAAKPALACFTHTAVVGMSDKAVSQSRTRVCDPGEPAGSSRTVYRRAGN